MKFEGILNSDYTTFKEAFGEVLFTFGKTVEKFDRILLNYLVSLFKKYNNFEMHYIGNWEDEFSHETIINILKENVREYWIRKMPELLAITNNLMELSVIPINDSTVKNFEQNADTFSMSENQPIDATENITTPYIKVKGRTGYTNKETVTHNTVKEALERVEISKETEMSLTNFIEAGIRTVIKEYNTAY